MTVENDIRRNGSGYIDQTAYKAILNAEKGEKKMEYQRGEIYEAKKNDGTFMEVVILAVHEETCTILQLSDNVLEGSFKVIAKGEKYTSAYRIGYVFKDKIRTFIRRLKDEEFSEVMEHVRDSLSIPKIVAVPAPEGTEKDVEFYETKIDELQDTCVDLTLELDSARRDLSLFRDSKKETEVERNLYKSLYENLLELLVRKIGEVKGGK